MKNSARDSSFQFKLFGTSGILAVTLSMNNWSCVEIEITAKYKLFHTVLDSFFVFSTKTIICTESKKVPNDHWCDVLHSTFPHFAFALLHQFCTFLRLFNIRVCNTHMYIIPSES